MVRVNEGDPILNHETGTISYNVIIVGYAPTREEGIEMLARYHLDPDFIRPQLTFRQVYKYVFEEHVSRFSKSNINAYNASYDALESLHDEVFSKIRMKKLQEAVDNCGKNYPTIKKIKVLLNQMYKWAIKYDVAEKDYAQYLNIAKHKHKNPNKRNTKIFSQEQIDTLWDLKDSNEYYGAILMLIYTGLRVNEFLTLKKENVNLEDQSFEVISSKTEAGLRTVPIADAILPTFKYWMEKNYCEYLITTLENEQMRYSNFLNAYWRGVLEPLGWTHTPHHNRHTCVTLLTEARVEPTFIKMIVGHEGAMTMTERVYTHISIEPLLESVNKIYVPNNIKEEGVK